VVVDVHVLVDVTIDGFWKMRLQSSPFEGPATIKPPALPADTYVCLIPHENEIVALGRHQSLISYAKIAELLHGKYQLHVCRETVVKFLRVRSRIRCSQLCPRTLGWQ
jgi:hypothetical protein